jgi:hypothetical protein
MQQIGPRGQKQQQPNKKKITSLTLQDGGVRCAEVGFPQTAQNT